MFLRGGRRNVTRREWGRKSAGQLQGQELKARQGPRETTTPSFPETQAEGPAVLPNSQRVKVGRLSWVGSSRERLVSRKRVGESNSWAGSSHRWVGGGSQAPPPQPSRDILPPGQRHTLLGAQGPGSPF